MSEFLTIRDIPRKLHEFAFKAQSAKKAAAFRIGLGIVTLWMELLYAAKITEYFTNDGYFSNAFLHAQGNLSVLTFVDSTWIIYLLYGLLVVATVLFTLGIKSRIMAGAVCILLVSFMTRNTLLEYGGDRLMLALFAFATFLRTDRAYTLQWYQRFVPTTPSIPGWPLRLIQTQVALMYLFTAIQKSSATQHLDGTYLFSLLNNPNFALFDMPWAGSVLPVLAMTGYATILAEYAFIFLVWSRRTNLPMIGVMVLFHLGIIATMNVYLFTPLMLAALIACLDDRAIANVLKKPRRR